MFISNTFLLILISLLRMLIVSSSAIGSIGYFFVILPSFAWPLDQLCTLQRVRQKPAAAGYPQHTSITPDRQTWQKRTSDGHCLAIRGRKLGFWFAQHGIRHKHCPQVILPAARKDWRTSRSSSHMYPSNIIAKLLRYFGNIPTTACLQAADCEVPQVSASHPCCVACLVCFLAVFISFGVFRFFWGVFFNWVFYFHFLL